MQLPDFLTKEPDGSIHITDHRIGLHSIVFRLREGFTPEQIAEHYPTLELDLVWNVVRFYRENLAVLEPYVNEVEAEIRRQESQPQSGPTFEELKARMDAKFPGWRQ